MEGVQVIQLGEGLGAGGNPEVGKKYAIEAKERLAKAIENVDMVFITAGMGGGTGTGAAPIVATVAREVGALTVGVVTKPFMFEGKVRQRQAEAGLQELKNNLDSMITIPNQKLFNIADRNLSFKGAFKQIDEILLLAVKSLADLILSKGIINLDFCDVQSIMKGAGLAIMGTGVANGENKAMEAARLAISSPLLEDESIDGARGVLINIFGGPDLGLIEVQEACSLIKESVHDEANIIFGVVQDERMDDQVKITVIATGFDRDRVQNIIPPEARPVLPPRPEPKIEVPEAPTKKVVNGPNVKTGNNLYKLPSTPEPRPQPSKKNTGMDISGLFFGKKEKPGFPNMFPDLGDSHSEESIESKSSAEVQNDELPVFLRKRAD
jgi:cell division protein FtsZ